MSSYQSLLKQYMLNVRLPGKKPSISHSIIATKYAAPQNNVYKPIHKIIGTTKNSIVSVDPIENNSAFHTQRANTGKPKHKANLSINNFN